jgi:hypothetical protein
LIRIRISISTLQISQGSEKIPQVIYQHFGRFNRSKVPAFLYHVPAFEIVIALGPFARLEPDVVLELEQRGGRFDRGLAVVAGHQPLPAYFQQWSDKFDRGEDMTQTYGRRWDKELVAAA